MPTLPAPSSPYDAPSKDIQDNEPLSELLLRALEQTTNFNAMCAEVGVSQNIHFLYCVSQMLTDIRDISGPLPRITQRANDLAHLAADRSLLMLAAPGVISDSYDILQRVRTIRQMHIDMHPPHLWAVINSLPIWSDAFHTKMVQQLALELIRQRMRMFSEIR